MAQRRSGKSDLVKAVRENHVACVTNIINDAPATERKGLLAQGLCVSCELSKLGMIQQLLSLGADPSEKFGSRPPPLLIAVKLDLAEVVRQLLNNGSQRDDTEIWRTLRRTEVTMAKSRDVAQLLIDYGVDVMHSLGKQSKTLLMEIRSPAVVEVLIEKRASLEAKDDEGRTALMMSLVIDEDPAVAKLLVECGADIEAKDNEGRNILMTAVWMNRVELLKVLIGRQVNVNAVDYRGRNVLHHLASDRKTDLRIPP